MNGIFFALYHFSFALTLIINAQFVIPRNEESHNLNNLMRFLVPRNDKIFNKYYSIFKAKLFLIEIRYLNFKSFSSANNLRVKIFPK